MTNNNESMATVVETFYVEETTNLIHDNEALTKWNEKVAELGLTGQTTVIVKEKSLIPFLWMNAALINTFQVLCPTKVEIEKYDKSPIPLELLETVSLCKKEEYFDYIEVWYNDQEKDSVIIGYKVDKSIKEDWWQKSQAKKYLIGRWADVKASLDTLIKRAKQLFVAQRKTQLQLSIKQQQRELEDIEQISDQQFGGLPMTDLPF